MLIQWIFQMQKIHCGTSGETASKIHTIRTDCINRAAESAAFLMCISRRNRSDSASKKWHGFEISGGKKSYVNYGMDILFKLMGCGNQLVLDVELDIPQGNRQLVSIVVKYKWKAANGNVTGLCEPGTKPALNDQGSCSVLPDINAPSLQSGQSMFAALIPLKGSYLLRTSHCNQAVNNAWFCEMSDLTPGVCL